MSTTLARGYVDIPISFTREDYIQDCVEFLYDISNEVGLDYRMINHLSSSNIIKVMDMISPEGATFGIIQTGALGYWEV